MADLGDKILDILEVNYPDAPVETHYRVVIRIAALVFDKGEEIFSRVFDIVGIRNED